MSKHSIRVAVTALFVLLLALPAAASSSSLGVAHSAAQPALTDQSASAAAAAGQSGDVRIEPDGERGLTITLTVPEYQVVDIERNGQAYQQINVAADGWTEGGAPGSPQLPERNLLLAVPPTGAIQLAGWQAEPQPLSEFGALRLLPVPTASLRVGVAEDEDPGEDPLQLEWTEDPAAYAGADWQPANLAEITQEGWLRGVRFVRVALRPFQVEAASGQVRLAPTLSVRLDFLGNSSDVAASPESAGGLAPGADPLFEPVLQATFTNPDQAQAVRPQPAAIPQSAAPHQDGGPWVKVTVNVDGLYQVTYDDLLSAGVAAGTLGSLDPRTFRLLDEGQEQHIYVEGEGDGNFASGDYLLFYGQRTTDYLTDDDNVYWLTWGGANGQRMATQSGALTGAAAADSLMTRVHVEQNSFYKPERPFADWMEPVDHDHWFFDDASSSKTVEVMGLAVNTAASDQPVLSLYLVGNEEDPRNYQVRATVNGQVVGTPSWTSQRVLVGDLTLPAGSLTAGTNTVKLDMVSGTSYGFFLDWIALEYPYNGQYLAGAKFHNRDSGTWRYRITEVPDSSPWILNLANPAQPRRVVNASNTPTGSTATVEWQAQTTAADRFLVVPASAIRQPAGVATYADAGLLNPNQQVDYLLITHADFASAAQPLVNYHANEGLSVRTVPAQAIYDEFSDGTMSFEAIREFLAYAYTSYQWPPPTYVLLLGDGTIDFRGYQYDEGTYHLTNWIPPYVGAYDWWGGTSISDNAFGFIHGDDVLAEMLIGRMPANSVSEAQLMVNKTIGYLNASPQSWMQQTLWVADNEDEAGDFHAASDDLISHMLPEFSANKVYFEPASAPVGTCGYRRNEVVCAANQSILNYINAGQLFTNFSGHGTYGAWAHEWLFINPDVDKLANGNSRLSFTVVSACATAYFARFETTGLDERLMRHGNGGIVGGFSPTTFDTLQAQSVLVSHFYDAIMRDRLTTSGVAGAVARGRTFADLSYPRNERTAVGHMVLGDPALRFPRPSDSCAVGDLDCDGDIDIVDIQRVAAAWNSEPWDTHFNPRADVDGNRKVDVLDLVWVSDRWGTRP